MFQALRQKVDTRWLSQKACFAVWDMVSTLNQLRSEGSIKDVDKI
ncbi:hypothetical protein Taro_046068, partial [Colocasia esculenta]|nr:hypothetical protein [Colocasia esculenta]